MKWLALIVMSVGIFIVILGIVSKYDPGVYFITNVFGWPMIALGILWIIALMFISI